MNSGFAGIDNPLFFADTTRMLFGNQKKSVAEVTEDRAQLDWTYCTQTGARRARPVRR
ncbi:NAD(P)(+) transhydrogenase (Re/Si-specific) subunit beta [Rhodococcus pseudokoreensis]|uniref:proton-translocating NAD(P)(+) transhydrogenase n=1 Tax=Rhodococcus pseudokoreensis TaxID=2811421 RepID=A0A974ZZ18_9NOCA|nr:NAD(P)(+) transhydrogenase (Re/Si-specific) subunit beta [Rhodococcus pseudokoreensis]